MTITSRRSFLAGAAAFVAAAPAIVRASSLMPVKAERMVAVNQFVSIEANELWLQESVHAELCKLIAVEYQIPVRMLMGPHIVTQEERRAAKAFFAGISGPIYIARRDDRFV